MQEECLESGLTIHKVEGEEVGASFCVKAYVEGIPMPQNARIMVCSGFTPGYYLFQGTGIFLNRQGLAFDYREHGQRAFSGLWRKLCRKGESAYDELGLANGCFKNGKPRFSLDDEMIHGTLTTENQQGVIVMAFDFVDGPKSRILIEGTDKVLLGKAIEIAECAYDAFSFNEKIKELT